MAIVVSVTSTISQAEGFLAEVPEHEFLQNRYFPTKNKDMFPTREVLFDFDELDLKKGVFVAKGYKNCNPVKYYARAEEPPRIALEADVDANDTDRLLFEQICYDMGVDVDYGRADVFENLKRIKVARMGQRVQRSIEKLAVDVLIKMGIHGTMATSDTDPTPIEVDINYYEEEKGNVQRFIPKHLWGTQNATPYRDVCQMCNILHSNGGNPEDLLISPSAYVCLSNDPEFKRMVETYHSESSELIADKEEGARLRARVDFGGFVLNVISYAGKYEDDDGHEQAYLPKDFVSVLQPGCGRTLCGGCVDIDRKALIENDPLAGNSFINRRAKIMGSQYWDLRAKKLGLLVESRPLPAPKRLWTWITMLAGNTNDVSEGTAGPAIDVIFQSEETGITLPDDMHNVLGGSEITFTVPAVSEKTCSIYLNGQKVKDGASGSETVEVPNIDCVIELVYVAAE